MVLADMKLAAETPSDVVLFNIDSKSDSTSKQNKDVIVNVFLKVFNERYMDLCYCCLESVWPVHPVLRGGFSMG